VIEMTPELHSRVTARPGRMARAALAALLAVGMAIGLVACGGSGVGSNGTGAAPQGSGTGTVTGFGSVYIDGVAYEDSDATVEVEEADGSTTSTETKMGQRVEVLYEPGSSRALARRIRVEASLIGSVDSVGTTSLVVLGQTVRVNSDASAGPVTVFDTATGTALGGDLTDVAAGDPVEVHAVRKTVGTTVELWATRVERLDALRRLRASGVITEASAGGFSLGSLTVNTAAATVLPANTAPAVDQWVVVYATKDDLSGSVLTARRVRIGERATVAVSDDEARLGGYVAKLVGGSQFQIEDVVVKLQTTTKVEPSSTSLAEGKYVRVEGSYDSDGNLLASEIHISTADDGAELHGSIVQLNTTTMSTFRVRDTWVDVPDARVIDWGECTTRTLADDLYVEVRGVMSRGVLQATSIVCEKDAAPTGKVIERHGTVSALKAESKQLTLLHHSDSLTVQWTATTYFRYPLTAGSLSSLLTTNETIEVEGRMEGSVLVATKIKPRSGD